MTQEISNCSEKASSEKDKEDPNLALIEFVGKFKTTANPQINHQKEEFRPFKHLHFNENTISDLLCPILSAPYHSGG